MMTMALIYWTAAELGILLESNAKTQSASSKRVFQGAGQLDFVFAFCEVFNFPVYELDELGGNSI